MTGEGIVRRAVSEVRREWEHPEHGAPADRWPGEGPVTVEQIERFAAELADAIVDEVFDRLGEMRFR